MSFQNVAAWAPFAKVQRVDVGPGPVPDPSDDEVVIKVAYAAVNPTDWKMQDTPYFELPYPWIFGTDVAGVVVQKGSTVTTVQIGQRVIGHCDSLLTRKPTNAGFQRYTTCKELLTSPVPDGLPLANAAVLPLSVSTASTALYGHLSLPYPTLTPEKANRTILIWGGSSSTGSSAIQLAVASGWTVATTASPANKDYVEGLGASLFFDHRDPKVVDNILARLDKSSVVVDCIGSEQSQTACGKIVQHFGGGSFPVSGDFPKDVFPDGVQGNIVIGLDPGIDKPEIGKAVWKGFLPRALEAGKFQAKPDPEIIKGGLGQVQTGINLLRKGVSAKKLVIEIDPETGKMM